MTAVRAHVPARAHLAGNPSDGYGGAVLSVTVPTLSATVTAIPAERVSIGGPQETWASLQDLTDQTSRLGYDGGDRLVRAALVTLDQHLDPEIERHPGRFEWSTTIPRSVGLGGSSAIVIATMRAALGLWGVDRPADLELARLALEAETRELGIAAGLADRTAQVIGGVVHTDCRDDAAARAVRPLREIPFTLLWRHSAAAPSGDYHARLRRAVDEGDPRTLNDLATLAALSDRAAKAVAVGDTTDLAATLDASLDLRKRLGPVPAAAVEGVDELRRSGAAVNFAGSGGAVVVLGPCAAADGWDGRSTVVT